MLLLINSYFIYITLEIINLRRTCYLQSINQSNRSQGKLIPTRRTACAMLSSFNVYRKGKWYIEVFVMHSEHYEDDGIVFINIILMQFIGYTCILLSYEDDMDIHSNGYFLCVEKYKLISI